MSTQDRVNEIVDRYLADPDKRAILDKFFEELMQIGDNEKIITTSHGVFRVVDITFIKRKRMEACAKAWTEGYDARSAVTKWKKEGVVNVPYPMPVNTYLPRPLPSRFESNRKEKT